ncbi:MAG: sphingomyelin synthase family protein [Leptospira sp.]|nr:sphingomyelin synthase family protein [Leptospira sp.]
MNLKLRLLSALILHYFAYIFMQTIALFSETRRGPSIPDIIHDLVPPQREFDWVNSILWLPFLLLSILLLGIFRPVSCINYLRAGAAVSFFRGIFILLTSLGPPKIIAQFTSSEILNLTAGEINWKLLVKQWIPVDAFFGGQGISAVFLTQDLFFSGHTATTFLLLLAIPGKHFLFIPFLLYHFVTVFFLILTHEHYSIDILGAYFIVYAIWNFMGKRKWLIQEDLSSASSFIKE